MGSSDFLSLRPRRLLDWRDGDDGTVVVLRPWLGSSDLALRVASWFGGKPYRIRLDEVGSLVWKSIDGETPLSEIADKLRQRFGARVEPAEDRLRQFALQMRRSRLIEF